MEQRELIELRMRVSRLEGIVREILKTSLSGLSSTGDASFNRAWMDLTSEQRQAALNSGVQHG